MTDETVADYGELMSTNDAAVWAREFLKGFDVMRNDGAGMDEFGVMVGWFAAAMGAQEFATQDRDIAVLAERINQTAAMNGWNDPDVTSALDGKLMLIVSECAEALEHWRDGKEPADFHYDVIQLGVPLNEYTAEFQEQVYEEGVSSLSDEQRVNALRAGMLKPQSVPDEYADIIIRALHQVVQLNIDIVRAIREKMAYNTSRTWRHGGKRT